MKRIDKAVSAAAKLALFRDRELKLTRADFERAQDDLIELLEEANNEVFALIEDENAAP